MGGDHLIAFLIGVLLTIVFGLFYKTLKGLGGKKELPKYTPPPAPEPKAEEVPEEEGDGMEEDFTIEHYPISGKYFPKYRGYYLYRNSTKGIYETQTYMVYAVEHSTEDKCYETIALFKEQKLKVGMKVIPVQKLDS